MKILVTGSAGNIGREQVRQLQEAGHDIRGFDRVAKSRAMDYEYIAGDLRDLYTVRQAVGGVDAVIHLGAIPSDRHGCADDVLATNVQGTWNVLLACVEAGVERIVNYSSVNALGCVGGYKEGIHLPVDDSYPRHPHSPYQISKHLGEEMCTAFTNRHGLITLSLRPVAVLYSENYHWCRDAVKRGGEHGKVEYWAYVDRRDVARAGVLALTAQGVKNDAFLLSARDTVIDIPTQELVDTYYANTPWIKERAIYLNGETYRALLDCSHAKEVLGWVPEHSWRDETL